MLCSGNWTRIRIRLSVLIRKAVDLTKYMLPPVFARLLTTLADRLRHDSDLELESPKEDSQKLSGGELNCSPKETFEAVSPLPGSEAESVEVKPSNELTSLPANQDDLKAIPSSPQHPEHNNGTKSATLCDKRVNDFSTFAVAQSSHDITSSKTTESFFTQVTPKKSTDNSVPSFQKQSSTIPREPTIRGSDQQQNLDWCRWPVCMTFYLDNTCPFGEPNCPDAHASSDFAAVINEHGLVRVCFDALGVGGRMCMRRPGCCRFFHAPAHIRYQLLELRHGNRLTYRHHLPISECNYVTPNKDFLQAVQETRNHSREQPSSSDQSEELTLSVAIVAALVARLLESRLKEMPGAADRLMAAVCGQQQDRNGTFFGPITSQLASNLDPANERMHPMNGSNTTPYYN
ncbi:unnamed protein product [Calicophoron daubneyi]|uniref:C3H1-type domain-containing protein n=1 Tax=Calicophoron daubneyi TaxID=300641 RepID=A0AAV2TT91_CALDB